MADQIEKKRTTVSIYGQQYTIVGYEKPTHVKEVANLVDKKMNEIKKLNPYLDTTRLAVLTALNIVDDYIKLKNQLEEITNKQETEEDDD
nr:cell division protein ZapA [Bacillus sp. FJAT-45350]